MDILGKKEVARQVDLSPVTIWRLEKAGEFPQRVKLGNRRVGWKADEIDSWVQSRPRAKEGSNVCK
jgi:prophage regulatory protein